MRLFRLKGVSAPENAAEQRATAAFSEDLSRFDWRRLMLPNHRPQPPKPREDTISFIERRGDPVRDMSVAMALETIRRESIEGDFAELGVFRGEMAVLYHQVMPERRLYLFDTFEGFPKQDLEVAEDHRFDDTSLELVRSRFPVDADVVFRKGYFPESAKGLEDRKFSFVMLDVDLFKPTLAGLDWFYPRTARGGYIFVHDYTSFESDLAISRALDQFLADKSEHVIYIPDASGSVVFRKI